MAYQSLYDIQRQIHFYTNNQLFFKQFCLAYKKKFNLDNSI